MITGPHPELPSPPRRRTTQRLEMLAFAVIFLAGTVLTAVGVFGEGSTGAAAAAGPTPSAAISDATGPTGPESMVPTGAEPPLTPEPATGPTAGGPPLGDLVMTTTARSTITPVGCRATLFFQWEIDLSTAPATGDAVILLEGPEGSKRYHAPLNGSTVELTLEVGIPSSHAEWTASLLTVGRRPVIETPLPVSVDDPMC